MSTPEFTGWFQRELKRRRWTQADFHRASGVPKSTVSAWSRGTRVPDPPLCDAIAEAFGFPVDQVLVLAGHRPRVDELPPDDPRHELIWIAERLTDRALGFILPIARALRQAPLPE